MIKIFSKLDEYHYHLKFERKTTPYARIRSKLMKYETEEKKAACIFCVFGLELKLGVWVV